MPSKVEPMAATLSSLPPDEDGWGFEIKWDGIRAIAYVEDDRRADTGQGGAAATG
jgi:bifunctional non-homologous end joining protein LigD